MKKRLIVLAILVMAGMTNALAQTWNLPSNRKNTRFTNDYFNIPRPALSMRGFDNLKNDSFHNQYSNTTYGVKQVLERVYGLDGISQDNGDKTVYEAILDQLNLNSGKMKTFTTNENKEFNSSELESRAFIALMSFIIEKNPSIFTQNVRGNITDTVSHKTRMDSLMAALHRKQDYFTDHGSGNPWKRSTALMKVVRAWDLYLALENAFSESSVA